MQQSLVWSVQNHCRQENRWVGWLALNQRCCSCDMVMLAVVIVNYTTVCITKVHYYCRNCTSVDLELWSMMTVIFFFFLRIRLRPIVRQPDNSSIISRVKLRQTTFQLSKRAGFDDVGHRLGLTTGWCWAWYSHQMASTLYHWMYCGWVDWSWLSW